MNHHDQFITEQDIQQIEDEYTTELLQEYLIPQHKPGVAS